MGRALVFSKASEMSSRWSRRDSFATASFVFECLEEPDLSWHVSTWPGCPGNHALHHRDLRALTKCLHHHLQLKQSGLKQVFSQPRCRSVCRGPWAMCGSTTRTVPSDISFILLRGCGACRSSSGSKPGSLHALLEHRELEGRPHDPHGRVTLASALLPDRILEGTRIVSKSHLGKQLKRQQQ